MAVNGYRTATLPGTRLVHRPRPAACPRVWNGPEQALFADASPASPHWSPWQVLGGPGTGKTTLITDLAAGRIIRTGKPESVLVLTHSRRAAAQLRNDIAAGLLTAGTGCGATREPMVRTVHSYAFGVLRVQAAACGNPPPRLLTGAEQDAVVREMLRGDLSDGATTWPARLRAALPMAGFAAELRELMLRATERGVGPEDIIKLGRKHSRPEWVAAGKFAVGYERATALRWSVGVEAPGASAAALDAAELIGAAFAALLADADLLRAERARIRCVLVDDAQHLDPQASALVRLIGSGSEMTVVAGDPDQSIYGFRGADPSFLQDTCGDTAPDRRVVLETDRRATATVSRVVLGISGRLPGLPPHRGIAALPDEVSRGSVQVRVWPSPAKEAAFVAGQLRRAHLVDSVPWSSMAVIVRSVPLSVVALRRALTAAGIPLAAAAVDVPPARRRGARWLLLMLRALTSPARFSTEDATALLTGPVGGADPVALRRLRRGLRRNLLDAAEGDDAARATQVGALLRSALVYPQDVAAELAGLTDVEAAPLCRLHAVLESAREALRSGRGLEDVLWAAWQACGLARRWSAASLRGGSAGAQADRDLDAVVELFDAAAAYVDRLPHAGMAGFVEYIEQQQIVVESVNRYAPPEEAVELVSAHAAVGREWDVVAVVGVQEGVWPNLRPRSSLLHTEELVELADHGIEPGQPLSRTAGLLADERRLLLVACSRARHTLVVTAVDSTAGEADLLPSRFIDELGAIVDRQPEQPDRESPAGHAGRALSAAALVAELRRVVCDAELAATQPGRHRRAARHLARLAAAGVRGAHPDEWYGLAEPSASEPLWRSEDGPVTLRPSAVEQLTTCPLRWALEGHGGTDGEMVRAVTGTMMHALVQALAGGVSRRLVDVELDKAWELVDMGSQWYSRHELARNRAMLDNFEAWLAASRGELTQVGAEVGVHCTMAPRADDEPMVEVRGRIDRVERDREGRTVIVDIKTAKTAVTRDDAREHPQLATYQVAAAEAGIEGAPAGELGGARLVYVAAAHDRDGATQREQPPLDEEALQRWRDGIRDAARDSQGPQYRAVVGNRCRHCPVVSSCPARDEGRQVTE